jgi:tryptophan-rich sensory protein
VAGVPGRSRLRTALVVVVCILAVELVGGVSARLAGPPVLNPWYQGLLKSALQPPGAVFGLAWAALYALTGAALGLVVTTRAAPGKAIAVVLFLLQLGLNAAWSPLFLRLHRMADALNLILAMALVTVFTVAAFWRVRRAAAVLMLPYLVWLGFAAYLNREIVRLNPDGGPAISVGAETAIPSRQE